MTNHIKHKVGTRKKGSCKITANEITTGPVGMIPINDNDVVLIASEALSPGDYINIFNDGGDAPKLRLADPSCRRFVHAFSCFSAEPGDKVLVRNGDRLALFIALYR